jgi:hypothetical protein
MWSQSPNKKDKHEVIGQVTQGQNEDQKNSLNGRCYTFSDVFIKR